MGQFFICEKCEGMLGTMYAAKESKICCDGLKELKPNAKEAATEKHIPEVTVEGDVVSVQVGSVVHPMEEEHFIMWIYLETEHGGQFKKLNPGETPRAKFALKGDKPVAVYEYCNIHGLWVKEL